MRHRFRILAPIFVAALLSASTVRATQIILQTVEQMTYRADAVVRAVPTGERPISRWTNPNGTGLIVTTTKFRVLESISGGLAAGQIFTVEHLGGTIGDISMMVPGMMVFRPGEEVVLFTKRGDGGLYHVLDLSMGKFEVGGSANGSRLLTRRDLEDVQVVGETPVSPKTLLALKTSVGRAALRKADLLKAGRPMPDAVVPGDVPAEGGR